MSELSDHLAIALNGVVPAKRIKAAKDAIADGATVPVAGFLFVEAMIQKGHGTEATATASLLSKASVAYLCRKLGATRKAVESALTDLAAMAIANGGKVGDDLIADDDELLISIHRMETEVVAKLPKVRRAAPVKVIGTATEIEP